MDDETPIPRAELVDYKGSGYDRGHMCPAGDNKWGFEPMKESFYLTNICPQDHNLNTGDWNELEIACRNWANKCTLSKGCDNVAYPKSKIIKSNLG